MLTEGLPYDRCVRLATAALVDSPQWCLWVPGSGCLTAGPDSAEAARADAVVRGDSGLPERDRSQLVWLL
ncbi:hypothetical protein AOB60_36470 [Streptomyces noursei]|uniref:Uncharacterized protein n=1 Tax=Streptomyces noursei TaxID=1971 RepID=A0A2N8PEC0_STRNR|nr:hypothetical protein AOB60_36470 [Streptomyces noursei]